MPISARFIVAIHARERERGCFPASGAEAVLNRTLDNPQMGHAHSMLMNADECISFIQS